MRRLWLVLVPILAACAQPPTKELEMTAARVARAQEAEAELYAEGNYAAAEAALTDARQRLAERNYGAAIRAASLASTRADQAYASAILRKQRMTRRARRQLFEILSLLEEAGSVGVRAGDTESLKALDDRLGRLERDLEQGLSAKVYEEGLELKNDSLEFLNGLREREKS